MENFINTLDDKDKEAIAELQLRFKNTMSSKLYNDSTLFYRFLKARDFDLNKAEAMLRKYLEWRKANQVDTILTDYTPKEVIAKYFPFTTMGLDKDGAPALYINFGGLDSRGLLKSCRKIDVIKATIQWLETNVLLLEKQSYHLGKHIDQWTMILNFEGLSLAVATHKQILELLGSLIVMYEGSYPERLKVAYFINASLYFTMAFSVVKHFLSERTYNKIKFFGNDGWKDELLKAVDSNVLPAYLGGARTDPDGNPRCESFLCLGGTVPSKYFIKRNETSIANLPGVEKLTVTRMSKTPLTFNIQEAGSHIEWEFETKNRDIAFSLHYKKNAADSQTKELIPKQRIDTYMASETGMYKCETPGIYIMEFDNTYSWIFQKEVYYKVSIVKHPLIIQ